MKRRLPLLEHPIGPWYISHRFIDPKKSFLYLNMLHNRITVFTTGKMVQGDLYLKNLHIERLLHDTQVMKIPMMDKDSFLTLLENWSRNFKNQVQPLKVKIIIDIELGPIFTAYYMQSYPSHVALQCKLHDLIPKQSPWSRIKTSNRQEYETIYSKAYQDGYNDAIIHDSHGNIIETTRSAFWFIADETLFYPDIEFGGLNSISRRYIIYKSHYNLKKWQGSLDMIPQFSRCYISNCVKGIQSVERIGVKRRFPIDQNERENLNILLDSAITYDPYIKRSDNEEK